MTSGPITIPATDGYQLAASLFDPEGVAPSTRTVIIAGATGVKRRFYERFATYLAERGLRAITFDYRGIGESLREGLKAQRGTMRDWGEKDLAGVLDYARKEFPEARLVTVGHSAGGQILGLTDRNRHASAMLAVAAQSGYWRHWPLPTRYVMAGIWYLFVPGLTRAFSYFPMQRLGMGENLPSGIALEWARWCRNKHFFVDQEGRSIPGHFEGFNIPILAYSFDDDGMAPRVAVDALMSFYKGAKIDRRHLRPAEVSARRIGHFGFFQQKFRDSLWAESARWLAEV